MNKLLIGFALVSSIAAQAQTTSAPVPATTAAPAAQTSTATVSETKPDTATKLGAIAYAETAVGIESMENNGAKAPFETLFTVGLNVKSGKMKYEIWQHAYSVSNQNGVDGDRKGDTTYTADTLAPRGNFILAQQVLKANYSSDQKLLGSEPLAFSARYYIPSSTMDKDSRVRSNGILRADINPSWVLNPKWTLDFVFSPRVNLYLEGAKRGTDARYRLVSGPSMTYNVSDAFNAYYIPYVDVRSYDLGRGTLSAEAGNTMYHEVGLKITLGKVTINPAIDTNNSLNDRHASIFSEDSRVFSHDTSNYNLNIYASF